MTADAKAESLAIPVAMRATIDARDGKFCRLCGRYLGERRALHHIIYGGDARGMGGRRRHKIDEIITLCWLSFDGEIDCHTRVHADKAVYQPLLLELVKRPGVTGNQVLRWRRARQIRNALKRR